MLEGDWLSELPEGPRFVKGQSLTPEEIPEALKDGHVVRRLYEEDKCGYTLWKLGEDGYVYRKSPRDDKDWEQWTLLDQTQSIWARANHTHEIEE